SFRGRQAKTVIVRKRHFFTRLREIRVQHPLLKTGISISDVYFSVVKTETDFFNRIGRFLPAIPKAVNMSLLIMNAKKCCQMELNRPRGG
ncbi:hypothetical protein, partial [Pseudomonas veronii]